MTPPLIRHYAPPRFTLRDFIRLIALDVALVCSIFALVGAAYGVL